MAYLMELMERDDVFRESVERTMQSKGGMGKLRETVTNRPVTQDTSPGAPYMRSELCRLETASGEPLVTADITNKYAEQGGRLMESSATIKAKDQTGIHPGITGIKMNLDMGYDRPDGPTLTEGEISESISVNRTYNVDGSLQSERRSDLLHLLRNRSDHITEWQYEYENDRLVAKQETRSIEYNDFNNNKTRFNTGYNLTEFDENGQIKYECDRSFTMSTFSPTGSIMWRESKAHYTDGKLQDSTSKVYDSVHPTTSPWETTFKKYQDGLLVYAKETDDNWNVYTEKWLERGEDGLVASAHQTANYERDEESLDKWVFSDKEGRPSISMIMTN